MGIQYYSNNAPLIGHGRIKDQMVKEVKSAATEKGEHREGFLSSLVGDVWSSLSNSLGLLWTQIEMERFSRDKQREKEQQQLDPCTSDLAF